MTRPWPTCARSWPTRWTPGRLASRAASTIHPALTPRPTNSRRLTGEAARRGGFYHTHVRYALGDRYLDPFREAIEIGRRGSGPTHITHFYHRQTHPGGPEPLLALVDDARAEGLDVTFDMYPYEWASTRLLIQMPLWIQEGGPGPLKERLADRVARERLRDELARARRRLHVTCGLGRCSAGRVHSAGEPALGSPDSRRRHERARRGRGRRAVRPVAVGRPARQPGHERAVARDDASLRRPPGGHVRHRLDVHRCQAVASDIRLVPARAGRIRARATSCLVSRRPCAR